MRPSVLDAEQMEAIRKEVSIDHEAIRRGGVRNLERKFASVAKVTQLPEVLCIAESLLGAPARLVRALFFDKTPGTNWFVGWHQDRTVTLNCRSPLEGWTKWTKKDGVHHVHPPLSVLNSMVTIRLHVDPADRENGCLCVIQGSHRLGILTPMAIAKHAAGSKPMVCIADAGDALIMHPLILHSSLKSRSDRHRRVVHLEYSSHELPQGLSWA
jgi:ectoine hydroxylase-related dioxygenase (phytanoyl-CoA dioxygenase family)